MRAFARQLRVWPAPAYPRNQARRQPQFPPQLRLARSHLARVLLVVEARQVQQSVQQQHPHLVAQRMPKLRRLPRRHLKRNRQVARQSWSLRIAEEGRVGRRRKRQHIRRLVFAEKCPVQPPQRRIVRQQHVDFALQPHRQPVPAQESAPAQPATDPPSATGSPRRPCFAEVPE